MLTGLLDDVHAQWIRLRAPIATALRPGFSDPQLDAVAERLGLRS